MIVGVVQNVVLQSQPCPLVQSPMLRSGIGIEERVQRGGGGLLTRLAPRRVETTHQVTSVERIAFVEPVIGLKLL